ncbi:hypothetical protein E1160_02725 [Rhodospirillaceae bacterium RKSG073]|nr:hypothetical protein [Curvivirga aplysinae]
MVDSVMSNDNEPKKKKSIIPYYFFAFFAVVLAANGTMVFVALSTWTGLETKNHYLKGLSYNDNLDGAEAMQALGWQKDLKLVPIAGFLAKVSLNLKDQNGDAIRFADVQVTAIRPTHHGYDQVVKLQETTPGQYEAALEFPLSGQWDIRQDIRTNDADYQEVNRFFVDEEGIRQ